MPVAWQSGSIENESLSTPWFERSAVSAAIGPSHVPRIEHLRADRSSASEWLPPCIGQGVPLAARVGQ